MLSAISTSYSDVERKEDGVRFSQGMGHKVVNSFQTRTR